MQIIRRNRDGDEIDLLAVGLLMWKHKVDLLFSTIVLGIATLTFAMYCITPMYKADITLYINNSKGGGDVISISMSDLNASAELVDTASSIIKTETVLEPVIEELQLDMDCENLINHLEINAVNNTEVFKIIVENASPECAANIANTLGEHSIIRLQEIIDGCSVHIVTPAKIPKHRSSPSYKKYLLAGAIVGFFLYALILLLQALMDNHIKSEEDMSMFELPVLATIPEFNEAKKLQKYGYYGYGTNKGGKK